jgi:uncharacterized protein
VSAHAKPFQVGVRDLIGKPGQMREHELDDAFGDRVGEGLVVVAAQEPITVDVRLESVHEGILASGSASLTADAECSRCLETFRLPVQVDFVELFAYIRAEDSEFQVVDDVIDLEQVVRDAVVLALPFNPVDRPDCAGLDPITGERLAPGTEWSPPEQIDPRWSALVGLLDDDEAAQTRAPEKE